MNPLAIVGAGIAAVIGAVIWAAITASTGYEIGYVAWGIGALVGFGTYAMKGRGAPAGVLAAVMTLLSIAGGKIVANDIIIKKEIESGSTQEGYAELMSDAEAYPGTEDPEALRRFIVDHGFLEGPLEDGDVDEFLSQWGDDLSAWKAEKPEFAAWQKGQVEEVREIVYAEQSRIDLMVEDLGLIDLVFAVLGLATAFKIAGREEEPTITSA